MKYVRNAMSSTLASKLVYKEGIHLIETQPKAKLAERALEYYRHARAVQTLIDELEADVKVAGTSEGALKKESKTKILELLQKGGARASLDIF